MSKEWLNDYFQLKDLIGTHPDIQITENIVSIPDDSRPEFYRLFNIIRTHYINDTFPDLLAEAGDLSARFAEVNKKTIGRLNLRAVELDPYLKVFLNDPCGGLVGRLYNPLFDLIKGKNDLVGFEDLGARVIKDSYKNFFRYGYEYWAVLSLIYQLAPEQSSSVPAYTVPMSDQIVDPDLLSDEGRPTKIVNDVPNIVPADAISFDTNKVFGFSAPKIILHSEQADALVGIGVDLRDVHRQSSGYSKKAEWLSIEDLKTRFGKLNLWPDICIYVGHTPEELRLEADYASVARPDLVVNVMENADWYETGDMEIVKRQHKAFKPRLGSFVICRSEVPAAAAEEVQAEREIEQAARAHEAAAKPSSIAILKEPAPGIELLSVGYDAGKLEPIINSITRRRIQS